MPMYQTCLRLDQIPYYYWDSFEKFKEGLPSKVKLYNALVNRAISDKNCEHVLNVQKTFKLLK